MSSVIYRWVGASAGAEVPDEGLIATIGGTDGTATVACVEFSTASTALTKIDGSGGSAECTNAALTNGQAYTYKIFQKTAAGIMMLEQQWAHLRLLRRPRRLPLLQTVRKRQIWIPVLRRSMSAEHLHFLSLPVPMLLIL